MEEKINIEQETNEINQNLSEEKIETTDEPIINGTDEPDNTLSNSKLQLELKESKDKYLRLAAEFDNYRKRTLKERLDLIKTASSDTIIKFLPIIDDFERALRSMDDMEEKDPIKEGILLIYAKCKSFLTQQGVKEIETENADFNADLHEAITVIPVPDSDRKGKIIDVTEKGYFMDEKVIRHSKVVIGG